MVGTSSANTMASPLSFMNIANLKKNNRYKNNLRCQVEINVAIFEKQTKIRLKLAPNKFLTPKLFG